MQSNEIIKYPIWHFIGSKHSMWPWIKENIARIDFNTVLDLFGGSGVVSHGFRLMKKSIFYNDFLLFLQIINSGLLQSTSQDKFVISEIDYDLEHIKDKNKISFFEKHYSDLYFFKEETNTLDELLHFILDNKYSDIQKKLLFLAFVQAMLKKRPFHTFHGTLLQLRMKQRKNPQTWDIPIQKSFLDCIVTINEYLESLSKLNSIQLKSISIKSKFASKISPNDFDTHIDLLYLDPPFISNKKRQSVRFANYLKNYHVVESMANYYISNSDNIVDRMSPTKYIVKDYPAIIEMNKWIDRYTWVKSFESVIEKFQDSIIILSYRDDSYITKEIILKILNCYKKDVEMINRPHLYNTPNKISKFNDLLFIAK